MSTYSIRHGAPNHEPLPPLFSDFCAFVGTQAHGAVGWFDTFGPDSIPMEWEPDAAERLNKNGFAFMDLPDGSLLALLNTGIKDAPHAVVLLGSEGDHPTIANSFEEFLILWSKGESGITELDDDDIEGRDALVAWLKDRKIKAPRAPEFDFGAWLDGNAEAVAANTTPSTRKPTADYERLGPKMRELVDMMGRRADNPLLVEWVTKTLGKKVPASTSSDSANVSAPKVGIELVFSHEVLNEKYEPIKKSARSFIPYLSHAWVRNKIGETVFGLDLKKDVDEAEIIQALGEPDGRRPAFMSDNDPEIAYWHRVADAGADVVVEVEYDDGLGIEVTIDTAAGLDKFFSIGTSLFIAWAAENGVLNEAAFAAHADLLAKVKKREALGSDLLKTALPRGLWDSHLEDKPGLRRTAYQWFHNMAGLWITKDLIAVFGKREGPYGHDEPKLDDDQWDKVDAANGSFRKLFGKWLH